MTWPRNSLERQIISLIGEERAVVFFFEFGGSRIFIPKERHETSVLGKKIGIDAVAKLKLEFGGSYLTCPLAREFLCFGLYQQGLSNREIGTRLRITESGVQKMLQRLRSFGVLTEVRPPKTEDRVP